jgi:hypothetical protein
MTQNKTALLLLRIGIALVFLYAAIGSLLSPEMWIGYFPAWIKRIFPQSILLTGFSLYEIALAAWILSNWKTFYAAIVAAITLAGIVITNAASLDILFRDAAILFAAISLAVFTRQSSS